jgi:hypothetical protein
MGASQSQVKQPTSEFEIKVERSVPAWCIVLHGSATTYPLSPACWVALSLSIACRAQFTPEFQRKFFERKEEALPVSHVMCPPHAIRMANPCSGCIHVDPGCACGESSRRARISARELLNWKFCCGRKSLRLTT